MPNYSDEVWNALNNLDSSYTERVGEKGKDGWVKELAGDAKFTVGIYNYLKKNNSDILKDIEDPKAFYAKFTEGMFKKPTEEGTEQSVEQKKFNSFYTTYKPLLKGKSEDEIIKAYRSGKIGDLDFNKNSDYKLPEKTKSEKGFQSPFDKDFKPSFIGDYRNYEAYKKKERNDKIKGAYNTLSNSASTISVMNEDFGVGSNSLTHSSSFDVSKLSDLNKQLQILKQSGASDELLDRLAFSNSNFEYSYPDKEKIKKINPNSKAFEKNIIATKSETGEATGFGGFKINYNINDPLGPFAPKTINSWWNEETVKPIKNTKEGQRFFDGGLSMGDSQDEYDSLLENYNKALEEFELVQRGELRDLGIFTLDTQEIGGAEYNEHLYDYANATNQLMKFYFEKTSPGQKILSDITKASVEETSLVSENKIAAEVKRQSPAITKEEKIDQAKTIRQVTDTDTYNSSASQITVLGRFTKEDAEEAKSLNIKANDLRNAKNLKLTNRSKEIYSGTDEKEIAKANAKAIEEFKNDPINKELEAVTNTYKSIIGKAVDQKNPNKVQLIIDPSTGKTIRNPRKEDLSEEALQAYNEYEDILVSYSSGIFTNDKVASILRNVQLSLMDNMASIRGSVGEAGYLMQDAGFIEETMEQFGATTTNDSKTIYEDFKYFDKAIKNFNETGLLNFEELTPLVGDSRNIAVQQYNSNLNKLRALSEVYLMNYDPVVTLENVKAKTEGFFDTGTNMVRLAEGIVDGAPEAVGLGYASLTDEELQQEFVTSMVQDFNIGEDILVEEENDEGVMIPRQVNSLQSELDTKLEDVSTWYKVGKSVPTFAVMLLETVAIEALTAGMGSGVALANIGRRARQIYRIGFNALGTSAKFSRKASTVMGGWTKMMAHEAMILEGSNQIGGAFWGRERMPVGSFAFGAVGARMGINLLSRNYAGFKATMLSQSIGPGATAKGRAWAKTSEIIAKNPTLTGAFSYIPKKGAQALIGTATIKAGEFSGSVLDLFSGDLTYHQFWDHALNFDNFIETYGAMFVMGARSSFKDGRLAFQHISKNVGGMTGPNGARKFNMIGKQLGLPKIKSWSEGNYAKGETFWTESQIAEAKTNKINEINANNKLSDIQKKAEIANVNKLFEFVRLKEALDGYRINEPNTKKHVFGKGTMADNMDMILSRISRGENSYLRDQALLGEQYLFEGVDATGKVNLDVRNRIVKQLQGAGMTELSAQKYLDFSANLAKLQRAYKFEPGSKTQREFFKLQQKGFDLNSKEKSLREAFKSGDITKSTLEIELENIKEQQLELLESEKLVIKENSESTKATNEILKNKVTATETFEFENTQEFNNKLEELEQKGGEKEETLYGANIIVKSKSGKNKVIVIVDKSKAGTARIEFEKEFDRSKPLLAEGENFKIMDEAKKNTMFHEVIHPVVEKYIAESPKLVGEFIESLKKTGEYDSVFEQVKKHPEYKAGYKGSEWMTIYAEMVRDGRLDPFLQGKSKRVFENFKSKMNEAIADQKLGFGESFFKSGGDARDFLLYFGKAQGKEFAKISEVANEAVKEYKKFLDNQPSEFKEQMKKSSVKDNGPEINKLYKKYQSTWLEGGSSKALQEMTKKGLLDNLIAAQLPYDRYKKGWTQELDKQFVQMVYGELTTHIKNFETQKQTTSGDKGFFPWINSYVYHKGLNIKNQLGMFDSEVSLDALKEAGYDPSDASYQGFGEGTSKPAYKPLTSKQVLLKTKLTPETVKNLDKTFADLDFPKLIEAYNTPAGRNQTISPFIREFKKDFGKKGQKEVAKTMGSKKSDYTRYLDQSFEGIIQTLPVGFVSRNFPYLVEKSSEASSTTGRDNRFTSGPKGVKLKSNITEADKAQFLKDAAPDRWQAKRDGLAYQIADSYGSKRFLEILDSKAEIDNKINLAEAEFETSRNEFDSGEITKKEFDVRRDLYMSDVKKFMAEGNAIEGFDGAFKDGSVQDFQQKINQQIEISNFRKSSVLRKAIAKVISEGKMPEGVDILKINNSVYDKVFGELAQKLSMSSDKDIRKLYKDFAKENTFEGGFKIPDKLAGNMAGEFINTRNRFRKGFKGTNIESKGKVNVDIETLKELSIETEAAKLQEQLGVKVNAKERAIDRALEGQEHTLQYFKKKIKGLEGEELANRVIDYLKYNTGQLITAGGFAGKRGQFFEATPSLLEKIKPILKSEGIKLEYNTNDGGRLVGGIKINGKKIDLTKPSQKPESVRYLLDYVKEISLDADWAKNNPEKFAKLEKEFNDRQLESNKSRDAVLDEMIEDFKDFKENKIDAELLFLKLNSYNTNMRTHLREAANLADVMVPLKGDLLKDLTIEHKRAADPMIREITAELQNSKNWNGLELKKGVLDKLKQVFEKYETALVETSRTPGDKGTFDKMLEDFYKTETPIDANIVKGGERYPRALNKATLGDPRARAILDLKKYIETKDFEASKYGKEHEIAAKIARNEKVTDYDRQVVDKISYMSKSATKGKSKGELIEVTKGADKALDKARLIDAPVKKARVFDFDDTVARTKSKVFATKGGEKKTLTAEEFAKNGKELVDSGWKMDFSDFNKVVDGKKGPLFDLMKKMKEAAGDRDMFILTARSQESAPAIKEFLDAMGIEIPLENITGLGNSTGEAKAEWLVGKAGEGYNDFYFADDHMANVEAVKKALEPIDVKSQVQQARMNKSSVDLSRQFNEIIEGKTGIEFYKEFSKSKAKVKGAEKKSYKMMPPSAQDFTGLMDYTLGKGSKGEAQREFYNEVLYKPYSRAQRSLSQDKVNLMSDFKALKKELNVPEDLRTKTKSGYTKEQAVRVNLWTKIGKEVPGLSKTDLAELNEIVENDPKLQVFSEQILSITKGDGYSNPGQHWLSGTITTDFIDLLSTTKRSKYLQEWQANVDVMFSEANLNKLEAGFGFKYREALENSLARMKAGKNRIQAGNRLSDRVLDYINNAQGTIMFLNMRSALLQTISSTNFTNMTFNNPLKMGKAFANQPQYWKDFMEIMNSNYLVDRRNGLKINIAESEIADAAATSKNKAKSVINYILEKGYAPTKFADSFAIASGGATWYRNRVNDLMKKKKGISESEAKRIAFEEFIEISEKSQQSSDPSKISQQQSSDMGRLLLQFVNTPMQYNRLQLADAKDLINRRGNPLQKIGRIAYYGAMQNLWFNFMQQGLFAVGFGDDLGEAEIEDKYLNTANGMFDSILRGTGLIGMTASVVKNAVIDAYKRSDRKRPEYQDVAYKFLDFSPAIKNKFSKLKNAGYQFDSPMRRSQMIDKGFSLDNPAFTAFAKVTSAITNIPLDRALQKIENINFAMSDDSETWQKVAALMGWPEWQLTSQADKQMEFDQEKEAWKYKQAKEDPSKYSKEEQINILKQHGYSDEDIKKMKNQDTRVATILKSEEDSGKIYTAKIAKEVKSDDKEEAKAYIKEEDRTDISEADKKTNANVKKYFDYDKATQVKKLDSLGFSKKVIREQYNTEQKRVDKLLKLIENDSIPDRLKKTEAIPLSKRTKQQAKLYKLSKQSQLDILKSLGISDSLISTLTYEADRVKKIEELYKNKK